MHQLLPANILFWNIEVIGLELYMNLPPMNHLTKMKIENRIISQELRSYHPKVEPVLKEYEKDCEMSFG